MFSFVYQASTNMRGNLLVVIFTKFTSPRCREGPTGPAGRCWPRFAGPLRRAPFWQVVLYRDVMGFFLSGHEILARWGIFWKEIIWKDRDSIENHSGKQ